MKIMHAELFKYSLPLTMPLEIAGATIENRDGFLIRLTAESGCTAWGEAAPLPGFSKESTIDVEAELLNVLPNLIGTSIPPDIEKLSGQLGDMLDRYRLSSSSQCGVEMALLNQLASDREVSLAKLLSPKPQEVIPVNGLIASTSHKAVSKVKDLVESGYKAVKLKVGRQSVEDDIKLTKAISDTLEDQADLRLDANRAWSITEALEFLKGITRCSIEYIEEPLAKPSGLETLSQRTGAPLALDESLCEMNPEDLRMCTSAVAVVIKPTLLGGFEKAAQYARVAQANNMTTIISSSFESSVGIAALAQFAAAYGTPGAPAGLSTINMFTRDLLSESINLVNGCINVDQADRAAISIDTTMLRKVTRG